MWSLSPSLLIKCSFSLSLAFSLYLAFSLSLFLSPSLSPSLSLTVSLPLTLVLPLYPSLPLHFSLFVSLPLDHPPSLSLAGSTRAAAACSKATECRSRCASPGCSASSARIPRNPPPYGCVIRWVVITYQCYQLLSASQLITTISLSVDNNVRMLGQLGTHYT